MRATRHADDLHQTWRLNPRVDLVWRDWGEESVVLDVGAGRVHLLDPLSAALLACYTACAQRAVDVFDSLAADLGADVGGDVGALMHQAHRRFADLGWLLPAAPA